MVEEKTTTDRSSYAVVPIVVAIAILLALAGSQDGLTVGGVPAFALAVGVAFLIQWVVFVPSYLYQTEKLFDLVGSLTYLTVIVIAVLISSVSLGAEPRSLLLAGLIAVWAVRLGAFLFSRIRRAGKDDRFDELKRSPVRFLNVWTMQGLWVSCTASAALIAITSTSRKELDAFALVGTLIWLFGFAFEAVADAEKRRFNADPANRGQFIQTGLWSRSRHPNYFGEIVLWLGIAIIAFPVLHGWQQIGLVSPVFVAILLTRISGIPLLTQKAEAKWGGQADYEDYKARTPVLVPRLR